MRVIQEQVPHQLALLGQDLVHGGDLEPLLDGMLEVAHGGSVRHLDPLEPIAANGARRGDRGVVRGKRVRSPLPSETTRQP